MHRVRRWWTRRRVVVAGTVISCLLAPPAVFATVLVVSYSGDVAEHARTHGRDALWLGHAWVDGRRTAAEIATLSERLRSTGIRDVYVHIGPLSDDGTLDATRYPAATGFLSVLHEAAPSIRAQAWLGNIVGDDRLDLSSTVTRMNVVGSARLALGAGFAGVHFDLEPVRTGSSDFLALLDAVAAVTTGRGAVLSVAAEAIEPAPGLAWFATTLVRPQWWTPDYLAEVASRVDQVVLMTYDTALPSERLYGGFVRRQTETALDAVAPHVDLLIGLPAYHTSNIGHHDDAETVAAALRGVRLAVSDEPERERFGVAIYVDFAATEEDWRDYMAAWVAIGSVGGPNIRTERPTQLPWRSRPPAETPPVAPKGWAIPYAAFGQTPTLVGEDGRRAVVSRPRTPPPLHDQGPPFG